MSFRADRHVRILIIGGGAVGTSWAYRLARDGARGWELEAIAELADKRAFDALLAVSKAHGAKHRIPIANAFLAIRYARALPELARLATTAGTAIGLNVVAADQYIALVLPARVFKDEFTKRGLAPENLSRAAADAGTVTSALVPWNSCGAYMAAVLGIPTIAYAPFAVFNIMSPILTVLFGYLNFKISRLRQPADTREENR